MRGFLEPALSRRPNDTQKAFAALSRHRRTALAKAAQTTLVKADQWARGASSSADISAALDKGMAKFIPSESKSSS